MEKWPILHLSSFDPDQENYFHANTFSDHIQRHHLHVLSPHKHEFYVCVCFTYGNGWHEIDFKKHEIKRGSIFFISPGQTHNWQFSDDTEGYIILHSSQFLHSGPSFPLLPFFRMNNPVDNLILEENDLLAMLPHFKSAFNDYSMHSLFYRQTCFGYLSLIYHLSARLLPSVAIHSVSERQQKIYNRFVQLIEDHFRKEHSTQFYADQLGISTRQLNRICAEVSGNTSGGIIANRLLLETQTLLAGNKQELIEISEQSGFNEYSYFSRWFKKQTGISPLQFRGKYRNSSG